MRKLIVLVGLILLPAPAVAQTTLGLKGGVGIATLSIEEAGVEEESVSRIVAGLEVGVPVSGVFGVRFDGAYAQKGGSATVDGVGVTLNVDYIQVSALATVATPVDRGFSIGVMAGPWAAYRLSCDVEASVQGLTLSGPCDDADFADFDLKRLDSGIAFGAAIEVPLFERFRWGLDALYSLGLAAADDDDTRTRQLAIRTGFVFPMG